jgi:hypothetical protein
MPYDIETEDGIVLYDIPDHVDPESDELKKRVWYERFKRDNQNVMTSSPKAGVMQGERNASAIDELAAAVATPVAFGANALDMAIAGHMGGMESMNPFAKEGAGAEAVQRSLANPLYQPQSELVKRNVQGVQNAVNSVLGKEGLDILGVGEEMGAQALERTDEPLIATAYRTLPDLLNALTMWKGRRTMQGDISLKDALGMPTPFLQRALESKGVTYQTLPKHIQDAIPESAPRSEILGVPTNMNPSDIAVQAIESGSRSKGLAPYMVSDSGKLAKDPEAKAAMYQEWPSGVVQMAKQMSPATASRALSMMDKYRAIKDENVSLRERPTDETGIVLSDRVKFVGEKLNDARNELDLIVENKLKGKPVDVGGIANYFFKGMDGLRIDRDPETGKINFEDSIIQEDAGSKTLIRKSINLLDSAMKNGDAESLHILKRQLDSMTNYEKLSKGGLSEEGRRFVMGLRSEINKTLRDLDPDYARVNDVLSSGLDVFGDLNRATATHVDIFNPEAMGTEARKIFGNSQKRTLLNDAYAKLDDLVARLSTSTGRTDVVPYNKYNVGSKTPDLSISIRELAAMADALDKKFGTVASTSLQGDVAGALAGTPLAAVADVATGGKTSLFRNTMGAIKGAVKPKVSETEAYITMEELLKRGLK